MPNIVHSCDEEQTPNMTPIIEFKNLVKTFGEIHAVADISFSVAPGRITGFLGPNGSGKSTSLRCLTGLITATSGQALIHGVPYAHLAEPAKIVGAALEATGFHPGRTGFNNLAVVAQAANIELSAVDRALEQVGMLSARKQRVGTYSLGMKQRLAIAVALLGGRRILNLDKPANGLDPEGIAWMRSFLQHRAANGGTVLISSHVLSEVQQTVDDVVVIANGKLVTSGSLEDLVATTTAHIEITTPDGDRLWTALEAGIDGQLPQAMRRHSHTVTQVEGLPIAAVGRIALHAGIELHGLIEKRTDLEDVFLQLTGGQS